MDHGDDPTTEDPEEERYDELDDIAEERRADLDVFKAIADKDFKAVSTALTALDTKANVAWAERVTTDAELPTTEVFADDTPRDDDYKLLVMKAEWLMGRDDTRRSQAREEFLAAMLGYTDKSRSSASADTMLSFVAMDLAGNLPTGLDADTVKMVKALSEAWKKTDKIFDRLADLDADEDVSDTDLDRHLVFLSLVATLRKDNKERVFQWDSRGQMIEMVEDLIEGMTPGDPVDVEWFYRRVGYLVELGQVYPPQAAEVARLALAVLAGESVSSRKPPDVKTGNALLNIITHFKRDNSALYEDGWVSLVATERDSVVYNSDFDLGNTWDYFYDRTREKLDAASADALDNAVGTDLTKLLTSLSEAEKSGTPVDVMKQAIALTDEMVNVEDRLIKLLGEPTREDAREEILKMLYLVRARAAAICRRVGKGLPPKGGIFDAAITLALIQADPIGAGRAKPWETPESTLSNFDKETAQIANIGTDTDIAAFRDVLNKWADAAANRRTTSETRPDPNKPGQTIDWPGLEDATTQLYDALTKLRAAKAGATDIIQLNTALDHVLSSIVKQFRSISHVKDADLMIIDPDGLAGQGEALIQPQVMADPAQAWKAAKGTLQAALPASATDYSQPLGDALDKWMDAANNLPVDGRELLRRSWDVLRIMADYRAEVDQYVKDPVTLYRFRSMFNQIAMTVATTLRGIKV